MVLSLPSALPIPAAGYSTPFGIIFIALGLQMLAGRHRPWLPKWAAKRKLSRAFAEKAIGGAARWLTKIEKLVHPRLKWISSPFGSRFMSFVVVVMAMLMTLPIPTTNTFPAAVIFLIGVGLSEEDGLFCMGAMALGVVAIRCSGDPFPALAPVHSPQFTGRGNVPFSKCRVPAARINILRVR